MADGLLIMISRKDRSKYKLHVKPEAAQGIDLDAIDRMAAHPAVPDDVRCGWDEDKVWLSDLTGLYSLPSAVWAEPRGP